MKKALIGAGGHAREVESYLQEDVVFFVDKKYIDTSNPKMLSLDNFNPEEYEVMVCVGDSNDRSKIVNTLPSGTIYFSFIHPSAIIQDNVEIGKGSFIGPFTLVNTNVKLGAHTLLNRFNNVGHDTLCGDFLSMMPGSIISGNCKIGDKVYMGTNSCIREKLILSHDIIVGLGSSVVKNINKSGTYVGTPVNKIK
jgi:sugar O-acyltransferase (sialic acid O-acetyltransferase NeuD family)